MDPRPGRFFFILGSPKNYVGIFTSLDKFNAYMQTLGTKRAVCGTMSTPKELADYLRTVPQKGASLYLINPVHGAPDQSNWGPLTALIERLDEFGRQPKGDAKP